MEIPQMTARINELAFGYRASLILFAGVEADVFSLLREPTSAAQVAAARGWNERGARMLLDGLVALALVEQAKGLYRNAAIAEACLVPGAPAYQGHIILHSQSCKAGWEHLAEAVRTGTSALGPQRQQSPEDLRNFILGMNDIARLSAADVVQRMDLAPYRHMLDVGGGPASYSMAFLRANPAMRATLFDFADVIAIAREQVEAAGLSDRFSFIAGDLTRDAIAAPDGARYDLVFVSNIIHSFGPEQNRALVRKFFDAMAPGGLLVIKDFMPEDDRSGSPFALIFALHMLVLTPEGDTYSARDVAEWTRAAGFEDAGTIDVAAHSRMWLARKPA